MKILNYPVPFLDPTQEHVFSENFIDQNLRFVAGAPEMHDFIFDLDILEGLTLVQPSEGEDHHLIITTTKDCPFSIKLVNLPHENQALLCKIDQNNNTLASILFTPHSFSHIMLQTPSGRVLEDFLLSGDYYIENKKFEKFNPISKDDHSYYYDKYDRSKFSSARAEFESRFSPIDSAFLDETEMAFEDLSSEEAEGWELTLESYTDSYKTEADFQAFDELKYIIKHRH